MQRRRSVRARSLRALVKARAFGMTPFTLHVPEEANSIQIALMVGGWLTTEDTEEHREISASLSDSFVESFPE